VSDLAEFRAGHLKNAERLIHGVPNANHPENSDKWPHFPRKASFQALVPGCGWAEEKKP